MVDHYTPAEAFSLAFPNLAAKRPGEIEVFRRVNAFICDYAQDELGIDLQRLDPYRLVDENRKPRPEVLAYAEKYYDDKITRGSQISKVKRLATGELEERATEQDCLLDRATAALQDPESLPPHMQDILQALPRMNGHGITRLADREEIRKQLRLTKVSTELWRILFEVNEDTGAKSSEELLRHHYPEVKRRIKVRISHRHRLQAYNDMRDVADKLNIESLRSGLPSLTEDEIPPKMRHQLECFLERGPNGLMAYPDLLELAHLTGFKKVTPLSLETVYSFRTDFLIALAYMAPEHHMGVEDLLEITFKTREVNGREITRGYNPYVDRYREHERALVRPGYKRANFDSVMFGRSLSAIYAIARFNGEFFLQSEFRKHYRVTLDMDTRVWRKQLKLQVMSRDWIDSEIWKLKPEFDQIIRRQSYLRDVRDLRLCLFLAQLVVLRFLGFRQQCLRQCRVGKNIVFNSKDSVTFHYEPGEIKNEVLIHQTISLEKHGGIDELALLIDVLVKYKFSLLDTLRSADQARYRENMGDAFFAKVRAPLTEGSIERYQNGEPEDENAERTRKDRNGRSAIRHTFQRGAHEFMTYDHMEGFEFDLDPHFLRAVCCEWMLDVLGMTWEEVSKALGDTIETLKRHYYVRQKFQDASPAFSRVSAERRATAQAAAVPPKASQAEAGRGRRAPGQATRRRSQNAL